MMTPVRVIYRSTLIVLIIITGCLFTLSFQRGTRSRRGVASRITCWWHKRLVSAFGVKLKVFGTSSDSTTLFVANHLSWLDIHIIGSQLPVRFLSKAEVRQWPVFGWLASKAGTLYIPRGGKNAAAEAIRIMQHALSEQQHVVLFPESTTSAGEVKRFHGRLMQSAIDAQCLLQPVAIRYPDKNNSGLHESVSYTGNMNFMQSVKNILAANNIMAELHFLVPVDARNKSRDELARYAEQQVKNIFNSAI